MNKWTFRRNVKKSETGTSAPLQVSRIKYINVLTFKIDYEAMSVMECQYRIDDDEFDEAWELV